MDTILGTIERVWENSFVQALVYLVIAFFAGWLTSLIVKKLFKLMKLDGKFDKWGGNDEKNGTAIKFIGKLSFLIVFLLFLPAVLDALGLKSVSAPITDFASTFISYIPNVIAASILVFIGIFVGQLLSQIVSGLLAKTKLDSLTEKFTKNNENESDSESTNKSETVKISAIIGKIINATVVLLAIVQALTVLNIETISTPALSIINTVFGAIPSIVLAVIVIAFGLMISNIVFALLGNILTGFNFDGIFGKIIPAAKDKMSITKLVTNTVRVVIILFVLAQGVDILGLDVLTNIMAVIIAYLPMVIKAIVIAIIAFLGANMIESFMGKSMSVPDVVTKILKVIIYTVAGFMILSQLEFATVIVNYAFIISLCALALAFAIAFGIGGRDFAKKTLDKLNPASSKKDTDGTNEPDNEKQ